MHLAGLGFNRLEGLDNLETITGNVELDGLNNIGNNISFNSLTTINGNLRILCPGWSDMTLFSSLTTVTGEIQLRCFAGGPWRYTLTSLNGIENLTNVGGDFKIAENQNLTDFCGVFNLLSTGYELSSTAQAFGPGNGYNPTFEQILNGECAL